MQEEKQRLRDSEQALQGKGVAKSDFEEILQLLELHRSAGQNIEKARSDQFYGYAFAVLGFQGNPQEAAVYLRKVARHIVKEALLIADQHEDINELLDAIPVIGDVEET